MAIISHMSVDYDAPVVEVQSDSSATDLENAKVPTGQTIKSYLNTNNNIVPISENDYAALTPAQKQNGKAYFRYEAAGPMRDIQDDVSATDLNSGDLPTGQTIKSYLNSNFPKKVITAQIKAGGSYTFTRIGEFDCALIMTFHPYFSNSFGLYMVAGGYTTASSAIKAILPSSDITIVKTDNASVKITSAAGTFAKMIM